VAEMGVPGRFNYGGCLEVSNFRIVFKLRRGVLGWNRKSYWLDRRDLRVLYRRI
jgi:hypothetical protein